MGTLASNQVACRHLLLCVYWKLGQLPGSSSLCSQHTSEHLVLMMALRQLAVSTFLLFYLHPTDAN